MAILNLATYRTLTNTDATDGYDDYITALIPVVQSAIENYCDRHFDAANYSTWYKFDCTRKVLLAEYPVNTLIFVGSPANVANLSWTTGDYTIQVKEDRVTVIDVQSINFTSNDYLYTDNNTLADLKTEIEDDYPAITVAIVSGYETLNVKLLRPGIGKTFAGAVRVDCHAKIEDETERTFKFAEDSYFTYTLDFYFPENLYIVYNAGYTTMPQALQMVAALIIKDYLALSSEKDIGIVKSYSITNYSVTFADMGDLKAIVDSYKGMLADYVKKTV